MIYCDRCQEVAYNPTEIFSNVLCMSCYMDAEYHFKIWMNTRENTR